MRDLFLSERRYMQDVLWNCARASLKKCEPVLLEHYSPPRRPSRTRFNNDYYLQFVPTAELKDFTCHSTTILPNTIGADIFLTVDSKTSKPLHTELLGGEAFPITFFKRYIEDIERTLRSLLEPVRIDDCAYCRVFIVGNDICFLAFPEELSPITSGKRETLCCTEACSVERAKLGAKLVYVDGWIQTSVEASDLKLISMREP